MEMKLEERRGTSKNVTVNDLALYGVKSLFV